DATTQTGSAVNSSVFAGSTNAVILVVLDGTSAPATTGLTASILVGVPSSFAQGVTIKGLNIRKFTGYGIDLITGFNTVVGNFIGTNEVGTVAAGNGTGINVTTNAQVGGNNRIGISGDITSTNIISGNTLDGVNISGQSTLNSIKLNLIGTNKNGTAAIANGENGVWILGASKNNTVGGSVTGPAEGNLISGNGTFDVQTGAGISGCGVLIAGSGADSNIVNGNLIGVTRTGLLALPNAEDGVQVAGGAILNTIGGTTSNFRNLVSGNLGNGVQINSSSQNKVQGNLIGTNLTTTATIPNRCNGISVTGSVNTIGGTALGARNVIGGSVPDLTSNCVVSTIGNGIEIRVGDTNSILNNSIGWDEISLVQLPNAGAGIKIFGSAAVGNLIGDGTSQGANSIYRNAGLGISLGNGTTPTPNGVNPSSGPNNFQNYPVITSVVNGATTTTISGTLTSAPSQSYRLQFFTSPTPNGSGFFQGAQYEGSALVVTDVVGNVSFASVVGPPVLPIGSNVTITATNVLTGDTSEFSVAAATTPVELVRFTAD
ncbi:MAG: hypothetical protein ABIT01_12705, partial [Thermoanaerobaculia bacterium]